MTTSRQTDAHKKAHADDTGGFIEYIADFENATPEQRAHDKNLSRLDSLHDDLNYPTNHIDNTRFLHNHLTTREGSEKGDYITGTKGGYGLVMVNNKAEPVNAAAYMPSDDRQCTLSDNAQASAYPIGSMSHDSEWWLVNSLSEQVMLYEMLATDDPNVTVLACLNKDMFDKTLRHFAEIQTIHITATADDRHAIEKRLSGVNAVCYFTVDTMDSRLKEGELLSNIIADADTQTIDLAALAWGTLGDISDPDSKDTPYPVEAWGNEGTLLRDALTAITYFSQVTPAMAGQCILGALSTIIQQYVNAPYALGNKFMPVSLFLLTEGESGSGKSRTVDFSHKALIEYQSEKRKTDRQAGNEWKAEKASMPKADLELWSLENPPPKKTVIFAKSGTIQGFLDNMLMGNTNNVAWSTAEAALFLSSHSMTNENASSNMAQLCDIWSGGNFDRLLSPRYNTIEETGCEGVRFTLDLQGQPPIIEPALNSEIMNGQGILPRFLFAFPDNMNGKLIYNTPERMDAQPDRDQRLIAYDQRCNDLLKPSPANEPFDEQGNPKRFNMPFENRQAQQALADYQTYKESQLCKGGKLEKYSGYSKRLHENTSRIATIMAFFDGRRFISASDINRASKLADYSMSERIRYTDKPQVGDNDAQKLLNWLIKYCHKTSAKQLAYSTVQSKVIPKALRFKSTFDLLIEVLESENYIKVKINGRARTIQLRPDLLITK